MKQYTKQLIEIGREALQFLSDNLIEGEKVILFDIDKDDDDFYNKIHDAINFDFHGKHGFSDTAYIVAIEKVMGSVMIYGLLSEDYSEVKDDAIYTGYHTICELADILEEKLVTQS